MLEAHCIDDLQFVVDFGSSDQAFELHERVAAFARSRAPRVIEEVFDRYSAQDQVWRLDALDVDLGAVTQDELESQWEMRLRERLAEALQAEQALAAGLAVQEDVDPVRASAAQDRSPGLHTELRSREQAQLDTLLHFLRFGHLPWHAPQGLVLASPLGQLAHEVLRDSAPALVQAWRACPEARTMVQRAARQFSPAWLARLAGELARGLGVGPAANWGADAQAWVDGFLALWSESPLPSTPPAHLLWEGLLGALWSDAGENDRSQPLRSMVLALAPEEARQAEIWHALQAVARRALDGTPPAPVATLDEALLRTCLAARVPVPAHADAGDDEPGANTGSRSEALARLLQRLQAWLPPHARDDDASPWTELLHAEASWSRQTLLQLTRSAAARRRMAEALPPSLLLSLTALWLGPTELALLQAATGESALWGTAAAPMDAAQRWESVLTGVLLHPAPALFSGTEFLDDLLRQRGERENRPVPVLLRELEQAWRDGRAGITPSMRAWLNARRHGAAEGTQALAGRRARLEAALTEGSLIGVEADWSDAMAADAAWLQDRVRRAARRPDLQRRIAREWSRLARTQLIGLWLAAPERTVVLAALRDPVFAPLAPAGDRQPEWFLWEDLIAHLSRLTPGSFFNADAYVRGLRERLAQDVDESSGIQAAVLPKLSPAEQALLRQDIELMQASGRRIGLPVGEPALAKLAWQFARHELVAQRRRYEPVVFAARLARHLVEALHLSEPEAWLDRWAADVGRLIRPDTAPRIAAAIQETATVLRQAGTTQARTPGRAAPRPPAAAHEPVATAPAIPVDTVHVANAGIVLVGAYLPQLFGMLQLTQDDGFRSPDAAERAVQLLHYLATGDTEAPETQLTLNKLLCGIELGTPVLREFAIEPAQADAIDGLLRAVIAHWKIIGHTSVAGLREAFLQRAGRLHFDEKDGWHLQVEARGFDMLLDQLPWGYSLQKFSWMERPLHVAWR